MKYFDELKRTMEWAQQPKTIFCRANGRRTWTFMYSTLKDTAPEKALEMPINESFQMQFTLGLALAGYVPISVYPRAEFSLAATGDMSNMIDKMPAISGNTVLAQVPDPGGNGPDQPVHPGHQHVGNFAEAFGKLFHWIEVVELNEPEEIFPAYKHALERKDARATLLIEHGNFYNQK